MTFARRLLVGLLLSLICSCTHRVDTASSSHAAIVEVQDTTAQTQTVTREVDAPGRETTTVEEYAPASDPANGTAPEGAAHVGRSAAAGPPLRQAPIMLRRTVTVKETGPRIIDTRLDAQAQSETHETAKLDAVATSHTETRAGPSPFLWLGIGAGLVAAAGLAWKFRRLLGVP